MFQGPPVDQISAGAPVTVAVSLDVTCGSTEAFDAQPRPDSVRVEVFDPMNRPVAHSEGGLQLVEGNFERAVPEQFTIPVTFTPDRPGNWHIGAVFEPSIGRSQLDLEAAEWRGDAGFREVSIDQPCPRYDVTGSGKLLCVIPTENQLEGVLEFPEQPTQPMLQAVDYALDGETLWRYGLDDNQSPVVDRLVEDGGVFELTDRFDVSSLSSGVLAAANGQAWLLGQSKLVHLVPADGGGYDLEVNPLGGVTDYGLVTDGDRALVEVSTGFYLLSDAGWTPAASSPNSSYLGSDTETLWNSTAGQLVATGLTDSGFAQASILLPANPGISGVPLYPFRFTAFPPVLRTGVVPRFDGRQISLEAYDAGPNYQPVNNATRRHAFAVSTDGKKLKIFDR